MRNLLHKLMIAAFGVLAGFSTFVWPGNSVDAQSERASDEHDDAQKAVQRGEIKSFSEIKRIVESRLGGRVVNLNLRRTNQGWQYFLRVSPENGRVIAAVVDARTGKILTTK